MQFLTQMPLLIYYVCRIRRQGHSCHYQNLIQYQLIIKINIMSLSIQILQAEGQLNRQITVALQQFRKKIAEDINRSQNQKSKDHYDISKQGTQKVFRFRQSLLSLKFQILDYKTIYNMMAASFLILAFCLIYDRYVTKGSIIDIVAFNYFFRGWQKVFLMWWLLAGLHFTIILVVFVAVKSEKKIWIPLYIIHQYALLHIGIKQASSDSLGFASVFILLCETIRMVMKSHSYFRTKVLYLTDNPYKHINPLGQKANKQKQVIPKINLQDIFTQIGRLSYFFIIPTLIYRDEYTRTPIRSMSKIITHLVNFLACTYYSFILYVMCCKQNIENLSKKLDFSTFILTVIRLMFPSVCFLILGFFGFLHSWLNLWAEITRFPDRAFYSDWWNSIEFGSYYRKWNIVVHDWLYYYIYLDFKRFFKICRKYRFLSQLATFLFSAVIHEAIVCIALGFFYPILFILFTGPGIILIQNQRKLKSISINFMFWLEMYIGTSLLFSFYLVQSFAREIVSDETVKADFHSLAIFIPRTFYLGKLK